MKIRRYVEKDIKDAILKMKYELGPDAMILSSKKVKQRTGLFGMFSQQMVEVIAAIDEEKKDSRDTRNNSSMNKNNSRYNNPPSGSYRNDDDRYPGNKNGSKMSINESIIKDRAYAHANRTSQESEPEDRDRELYQSAPSKVYTENRQGRELPSNNTTGTYNRVGKINRIPEEQETLKDPDKKETEKIKQLEHEVSSMKNLLKEIYNKIGKPTQSQETKAVDTRDANHVKDKADQAASKESTEDIFEIFTDIMIDNEVDRNYVKEIVSTAKASIGETADRNKVYAVLCSLLKSLLGSPKLIETNKDKPTVVLFVGPTGVGKTTTLAKIAANFLLKNEAKIGFITADTYRIAAVEQLKTYAGILGIPVTVIYSPTEIVDAIDLHQDKDIIFIDTAGRSSKNKTQFEEIKTLVKLCNADEIFLVLSATASKASAVEIMKSYGFLQNYKLIFTKLDETSSYGIILNTVYASGKRTSYVTTGQNVPDDIEIANVDSIIENLLN